MGLMKKHQQAVNKGIEPKKSAKVSPATAQEMKGLGANTVLARFTKMIREDALLLKEIQSHEQRDEEKKLLIPKYEEYLASYISQDKRYNNPVLVQVMVWLFDINEIERALGLAGLAITQKDNLPDGFNSKLQDWVLDTLFDWCEKEYEGKRTSEPFLSATIKFIETIDTFDQIKAKYQKLAGHYAFDAEQWEKAVDHYLYAEKLNPKIQVKTKREAAQKKLEELAKANKS